MSWKTKNLIVQKPIPLILARVKVQLLPEINEGDEKLKTEPNSCSCIALMKEMEQGQKPKWTRKANRMLATKLLVSRGGREIASKKDSSAPRSRKLRPEVVVGDEKFKTMPKQNRNERNKNGRKT